MIRRYITSLTYESEKKVIHKIDKKYIPNAFEVGSAIKTGGIGWTNEKVGFDVSWEGDIRGLEETGEGFYKVSSTLEGITSKDDLVGATIVLTAGDQTFEEVVITDESFYTTDNIVYGCVLPQFGGIAAAIAFDDGDIEEADTYSQGIWFVNTGDIYVSRLYKDAVHKIDPKYLPEVIGDPGATFTPSVDSGGNLSWTNDRGLDNPETCNIKGPKGDVGLFVTNEMLPSASADEDEALDCGFTPSQFIPQSTVHVGDYIVWLRNGGVYQIRDIPSSSTVTVSRVSSLKGADGRTPVKGTDYWTASDKQNIVNEVKNTIELAASDISVWQSCPEDPDNVQDKIDEILYGLSLKQSEISDLDTIRNGAAKGATSVQPSALNEYAKTNAVIPLTLGNLPGRTSSTVNGSDYIPIAEAPDGTAEKVNLQALKTYINNGMQPGISIANPITSKCVIGASTSPHFCEETVETALETLYSMVDEKGTYSKPSDGIPASDLASGVIPAVPTSISQLSEDSTHRVVTDAEKSAWNAKQDAISDITVIRNGAALGATALQEHQDISGKQDKSTLEADVAAKGFTKNTGTYSRPSGGIPKIDLASDVQASLGKADTALQYASDVETALINEVNLIWGTSWNGGDVVDALYYAKNSLQSVPDTYRTAAAQDTIDNTKQDKLSFEGTYNASTNKVVTKSYVDDIVGDILNRLTNI